MSRSIALYGMMGVGKTTIAELLGARLGRRVVDTDAEIARWVGEPIATIFATRGEAAFRDLERQVVEELARFEDLVLSLGGGTVLRDDNVASLLLTGVLVELRAPVAVLVERLSAEPGARPLLADGDLADRVAGLAAERSARYAQVADVTIDASGTPDEVVTALLDWLRESSDALTPSEFEWVMR